MMNDPDTQEHPICPFCGQPIEEGQATATVKGKLMHFTCYQEQSGGATTS